MSTETHRQLANDIWSICNLLRGPYKRNEYRKGILPLTVLRRFDLEATLQVGYRVRSHRGTQFRRWATDTVKDFRVKGFVLDDERCKAGRAGPTLCSPVTPTCWRWSARGAAR